jgi:MFS family permease
VSGSSGGSGVTRDATHRRSALGGSRVRGFPLLWSAQTISLLGSQVTLLALPLTALTTLDADPVQVGVLTFCGRAPYLVLGLLSGVLVDRLPLRRLLVACHIGLGALLLSVPAVHLGGQLTMGYLYAVATAAGCVTVVLDVAYLTLVPTVVDGPRLVRAQSALEFSQSAALALGPPLAGWLIGAFSPPTAITADAASFLVAAVLIAVVATPYARPRPEEPDGGVLRQAASGVRFVFADGIMRAVTLATGTFMFWYSAYSVLLLVHLTERVGLSAGTIGVVVGVGALGGIAGSLAAPGLGRILGLGRVLMGALVVSSAAAALAAAAVHPRWAAVGCVGLSQFALWFGQQTYNVHQVPVRYALSPPEMRGRVNASIRTCVWSLASLGSLAGGAAGQWLGPRTALLVSAVGGALAVIWIAGSPLRHVTAPALVPRHETVGSGA